MMNHFELTKSTEKVVIKRIASDLMKYKNFGTANGWAEVPQLIELCAEKKHFKERKNIGKCLTEVSCNICKYRYEIDSSD